MATTGLGEWIEDTIEQVCSVCGAELRIVANGSRPEIDLVCDCGADCALS
ncbi:MAG TPA: hypothetical protein VHJ82_03015 [Actinomycetota bacterium]|nr:hypothetical protein [Actinomycetota bacterium]